MSYRRGSENTELTNKEEDKKAKTGQKTKWRPLARFFRKEGVLQMT